ncbi:PREDICTED: purine nucleoside phosphorylase-like [Priapulus caudatus]|uniref:purine-nucleoside phosphorylase n=1 Tax=Priapulus caudatus TaxID=37621 RepID=A0ABM1EXH2_PRICU|nr:PREDICTED: purine nucleoside phosphorylase-like [Priapulus caudatus]
MSVSFDASATHSAPVVSDDDAFASGTAGETSTRRRRLLRVASQHESDIDVSANYLLSCTAFRPKIGMVAGLGISGFTKVVEDKEVIRYEDIPGFPQPATEGAGGELVFGRCNGRDVVVFEGRFFAHEGYDPTTCAMPMRVLKRLGVTVVITTGVCGALNEAYRAGDFVVVKDQLNFPGTTRRASASLR